MKVTDVIAYLNSLVETDSLAIRAMLCMRIPCNEALADDPTCIVDQWEQGFTVGLMGLINGMFGLNENDIGKIAYMMNEDGSGLQFIETVQDA